MLILKPALYILAALAISNLGQVVYASAIDSLKSPHLGVEKLDSQDNATSIKVNAAYLLQSPAAQDNSSAPDTYNIAQATTFPDIQNNWARSFIEALAARNVISGFPDGSFRPDALVTRAQFAAMISQAFPQTAQRQAIAFNDVPPSYWASEAIQAAYQSGFLAGYPNNVFLPEQNIPRAQALVSLASGLNLRANDVAILDTFQDAGDIPDFARNAIAAATENRLVVNYPNLASLSPNQIATRADVAAFIYQALVRSGTVPPLRTTDVATQYIVGEEPVTTPPTPAPIAPQEVAQLREQFRIEPPTLVDIIRPTVRGGGSTVGSPTAFGADWGDAFLGASFQARARNTNRSDGGVSFGFGLGDAQRTVGLEVAVSVVDLIGNTFEDGGVSFKLHRVLPNNFGVAVGVENATTWGSTDGGSSVYGVVSKIIPLRDDPTEPLSRLTLSLGLGGGRFRSESDVQAGNETVNVFGSIGLQALERVSLIADWTGQDLNLGASIVPFNIPLVVVLKM
ncbi:S-layer homology domain-containing protein [Gloeocapsopsis dulcis]|uniref:S-layer protein n=1 Tax=Gloeocapsopsis dulcis AAB1 = 1H9 TaxID=1433147 RepID=A0A6N8G414_9CHRO|nr:S-layer homology domain-containing protein [Gloeocapsopsis dulcis]MUL38756.1 S-layer protein [Gloeocapsopsis dulcis AAB1 = 1H9]WNN91670.1 S-layer homology domain-containing protein [Gloeocapsopsis dulcis]